MADIEKLGRYDIIRVVGKGAMGVVYEGRDPNLDRQVAIKTIRVQSLSAQAASEYEVRFRTEARSAARLHHANIVSVFDSGQDGDIAYLVMEFIAGRDLLQLQRHLVGHGRVMSGAQAIHIILELLDALDYAHRKVDDTGQPLHLVRPTWVGHRGLPANGAAARVHTCHTGPLADHQGVTEGRHHPALAQRQGITRALQRPELFAVESVKGMHHAIDAHHEDALSRHQRRRQHPAGQPGFPDHAALL
jgi:hypothetical protein